MNCPCNGYKIDLFGIFDLHSVLCDRCMSEWQHFFVNTKIRPFEDLFRIWNEQKIKDYCIKNSINIWSEDNGK